jgi:hypothetical protein
MRRHQGGDRVKAGFYFNLESWEVTTMSGQGGVLGGTANSRYLRVPLPLLLVLAPLMGAAFAMFLPFIGIAMVLDFAAKRMWAAGREAMHAAVTAVSPRAQTGEAYFTGEAGKKGDEKKDGEAEARLKDLEKEIDEHENQGPKS